MDASYCNASSSLQCGQKIDHAGSGQISILQCIAHLISDALGHPSSQYDG